MVLAIAQASSQVRLGTNRVASVMKAKAGTGSQSRERPPSPSRQTPPLRTPGRSPPRSGSVHMPPHANHRDRLDSIKVPGRPPPCSGLCTHAWACTSRLGAAQTLRCMKYRPSARLRPPLIGFNAMNASPHQRASESWALEWQLHTCGKQPIVR